MTDVYESLLNWAKDKIEGVDGIELRQSTIPLSGMGVFAKKDFEEGAVILKSKSPLVKLVPELGTKKYGVLITSALPTEKILGFNDNLATMVLYLLLEKFSPDTSELTPYLDSLPTDLSHLPIFWTDEELTELQNSSAITTIVVYRHIAKIIFDVCVKKIQTDHGKLLNVTQDEVTKVLSYVTSRSWAHKTQGFEMRPVLDMFNMQPTGVVPGYDEKAEEWFLLAPKGGLTKGKEIFVTYGYKPHSDMLYLYGIHNPAWKECEQLKLHINIQNPSSTVKHALKYAPEGWNNVVISKDYLDSLLVVSRMIECKHGDLSDVESIKTGTVLNVDNEKRALKHSIDLLTKILEAKTTTLEKDKELLTTTSQLENPRLWTAVSVRRFEKEIGQSGLKWLEDALSSMEKKTSTSSTPSA